jgi:hypothetical protein
MRHFTLAVILALALAGCGGAQDEAELSAAPQAMINLGSGLKGGTAECPGGKAPVCVACQNTQCVAACYGDHTCEITRDAKGNVTGCGYAKNACRTLSFAPLFSF